MEQTITIVIEDWSPRNFGLEMEQLLEKLNKTFRQLENRIDGHSQSINMIMDKLDKILEDCFHTARTTKGFLSEQEKTISILNDIIKGKEDEIQSMAKDRVHLMNICQSLQLQLSELSTVTANQSEAVNLVKDKTKRIEVLERELKLAKVQSEVENVQELIETVIIYKVCIKYGD